MKKSLFDLLPLLLLTLLMSACSHDPLADRALQGDVNAQMLLAGSADSPEHAFHWYEKAALQGHPDAQNNLGVLYQRGQGTPLDYQMAYQWFSKSAEQGNGTAEYNLGNLYERGLGVPQDYSLAIQWYKEAAAKGITNAFLQLGEIYYDGSGVKQDLKNAYAWSALAAANGNLEGEKLRNKSESLLNVDDLVAAQKMATDLNMKFSGKAL